MFKVMFVGLLLGSGLVHAAAIDPTLPPANLLPAVEQAMIRLAGSGGNWLRVENALKSSGRWSEVLY